MSLRLGQRGVRVVLLDIEGTTTPIAFVRDVLFPFARAHLSEWMAMADPDVRAEVMERLAIEHAADDARGEPVPRWDDTRPEARAASAEAYVTWLMDRDRKSPALKLLQGLIWERGYQAGELRGAVYPDVVPALARWRAAGLSMAVYSSGSELAQRRLFSSTPAGDLTSEIVRFFDTGVGAKVEPSSYARVARELGCDPRAILFVSDLARELDAAFEAGCQVVLSVRPGNPLQPEADRFEAIRSFDEID